MFLLWILLFGQEVMRRGTCKIAWMKVKRQKTDESFFLLHSGSTGRHPIGDTYGDGTHSFRTFSDSDVNYTVVLATWNSKFRTPASP